MEVVRNTESAKDKREKADLNLERSRTSHQGIVKMLAQYRKLYDRQKEIGKHYSKHCFLEKKYNTLIFSVSNISSNSVINKYLFYYFSFPYTFIANKKFLTNWQKFWKGIDNSSFSHWLLG